MTAAESQGSETCEVGGGKNHLMATYSARVKHGKTDRLKIKHITLFCYLKPKKSVIV